MNVVIIGGGVGGLHAAITAKAQGADVTVITNETKGTYRRSGLPDIVAGYATIESITVPYGKETEGIEFLRGETATEIDIIDQTVALKSGKKVRYDSLILATGSRASMPNIDGVDSPYVCTLKSADDLPKLLDVKNSAVVVGAGFVALMTAEGYVKRRVKTTLMVRSRILRAAIEPEIADIIETKLREHGIDVVKGSSRTHNREQGRNRERRTRSFKDSPRNRDNPEHRARKKGGAESGQGRHNS